MKMKMIFIIIVLCSVGSLNAQTPSLKVFMDCEECNNDFVAQRLAPIVMVRERATADVHVRRGSDRTGSGRRYTLWFEGLGIYESIQDTVRFYHYPGETDRELLERGVNHLLIGLYPYIRRAGYTSYIKIAMADAEDVQSVIPEDDPWNGWIFQIGGWGSSSGESNAGETDLRAGINIKHIGEVWKFEIDMDAGTDRSHWIFEEESGAEEGVK